MIARRHRGARSPAAPMMTLGALGVVFGDIGTSPLYALHTAFSMRHNAVHVTPDNVYGIISLVLWTITAIVTVKYVLLVIRADNDGEGGILALVALLLRRLPGPRPAAVVTVLGVLGAALFFGDAAITPAISVLSAVEGLTVVSPGLGAAVVPVTVGVLAALFLVQPFGTSRVSWAFGPVMLVWFVVLAALGIPQILAHPTILQSLSPTWALELLIRHPLQGFVLMGAVVLTVTGAEALYADLGHFSAAAIRRAWFLVVLPALALVYLGQGALVISRPDAVGNPLYTLAPDALRIPLIVLATAATIIASQAVISGTFSIARQAVRLSLLPRLAMRYTSRHRAGEIYVPTVNRLLLVAVVVLVVLFGSSESLASAYGLAVTGTLVLESVLFLVMLCWRHGYTEVSAARRRREGPLEDFLDSLDPASVRRSPQTAVFPHADPGTTPLALVSCVHDLQIYPERVVLVRLVHTTSPREPLAGKYLVEHVDGPLGELARVTVRVGFTEDQDIPRNLARASVVLGEDLVLVDPHTATYFLSTLALRPSAARGLRGWWERLFVAMERNQANRTEVFHLPHDRTVVMGEEMRLGTGGGACG